MKGRLRPCPNASSVLRHRLLTTHKQDYTHTQRHTHIYKQTHRHKPTLPQRHTHTHPETQKQSVCQIRVRSGWVFGQTLGYLHYPLSTPDLLRDTARRRDGPGSALHGTDRRLRGVGVSILGPGQSRGRGPLRGHQRGLALLALVPIGVNVTVAQGPRAGHVLRYTVICGHA